MCRVGVAVCVWMGLLHCLGFGALAFPFFIISLSLDILLILYRVSSSHPQSRRLFCVLRVYSWPLSVAYRFTTILFYVSLVVLPSFPPASTPNSHRRHAQRSRRQVRRPALRPSAVPDTCVQPRIQGCSPGWPKRKSVRAFHEMRTHFFVLAILNR